MHVRRCTAKPPAELAHESVYPTDAGRLEMARIWRKRQLARAAKACDVAIEAGAEATVWRALGDLPHALREEMAKRRKIGKDDRPEMR